jgi:hypothetical protein
MDNRAQTFLTQVQLSRNRLHSRLPNGEPIAHHSQPGLELNSALPAVGQLN